MKKLFIGLIVGAMLCLSATTAFAATAKQYVLTQVPYPIYVNGTEYRDAEHPILNYQGATYVPLAKLGDLTGVQYTWNDKLGRVEIVVSGIFQDNVVSINDISEGVKSTVPSEAIMSVREIAERKNIQDFINSVPPVVVNQKISGYISEGERVEFKAYFKNGNGLGTFTDEDDSMAMIARVEGLPAPPKISEGWIRIGLLFGYEYDVEYKGNDLVIKTSSFKRDQEEFVRLTFPEGWKNTANGETVVNGIRVKAHNNFDYFNIEDLITTGILK
ncbi:hypothetical protein [Desulfotomaculum sp. 1211_IL3151]|uniref:hypothetical protein n=1 Tax=Desulfotomaculum sp. 1211_IL3151 TaxID=3084055 RepID=UPI002FD96CDC